MRRAFARPGNTRSLIASLSFRRARTVGRFKQLQPQSLPRWQCGLNSDLIAPRRRGDRVTLLLHLLTAGYGTFQSNDDHPRRSACRGKPDIARILSKDRPDPNAVLWRGAP